MPSAFPPPEKLQASDAVVWLQEAGVATSVARFRKRQVIFGQGTRADALFYLQNGRIKLTVVSKQGKEAIITILPAGSFFGEGCLAREAIHLTSATALIDCAVISFKRQDVLSMIRENPDFAEFFVTYLLQRNFRTEENLVDQLVNSCELRLARALILLAHFGKDEPATGVIVPEVSQETLARMIGTTRSRVNFFMNKFRRLGFIGYDGGLHVYPALLRVLRRD